VADKAISMVKTPDLDNLFSSDTQFNLLYTASNQQLAKRHWTPIAVARMASAFLASEGGARILDIGSGAGKFCLAASYFKPDAFFEGIEQRSSLLEQAESVRNMLGLFNASFIPGNFTQLNFNKYDHFYFFNSFFENLDDSDKIDDSIQYSTALYNYYTGYLYKELEKMPVGTKIATYCSWLDEIPPAYKVVQSEFNNRLKFHIRTTG
jgi:SAM-dependent methyltransferase